MSTRSGRSRPSALDSSPVKIRKGASPSRSPGRPKKSSSPARSPSRKSPSRKSPSRKPVSKFPARKSPSRAPKEDKPDAASRSPGKRAPIRTDIEIKLVDFNAKVERPSRPKRTEYSIKDVSSPGEFLNGLDSTKDIVGLRNRKSIEELMPRRSNRIQGMFDNYQRSQSKSASKSISHVTFSDEESDSDLKKGKSRLLTRKLATPIRESIGRMVQFSGKWEFGGLFGSAALIILLPLVVFTILASCSKGCTPLNIADLTAYKSVSPWYNLQSALIILGHVTIQVLFVLLPVFGTKADKQDDSGKKYSFNAFFASIVSTILLFTLDFFKILNTGKILNDYLKLASISYILAVVLAIAMYVKSRKLDKSELNSYGNTGYLIYDFWIGREVHPQIRSLDVKIWISRICNISTLILAILLFKQAINVPIPSAQQPETQPISIDNYRQIIQKVQLKPTLLLFSLLQIVYILNFIMREYKITSTFFWHSEGVGYLQTVASALYPFYFTSISKYIAHSGLELSSTVLVASAVVYLLGFLIMMISNNVKHEFRNNPLSPRLSNMETMPTFHGKKLLISSLWGKLRHPNYTGDILIHVALAIPGIVSNHYIAAAPALLTILVLLHRAIRDHFRCKRRYGAAWQRYCKRVPSVLLPKVL